MQKFLYILIWYFLSTLLFFLPGKMMGKLSEILQVFNFVFHPTRERQKNLMHANKYMLYRTSTICNPLSRWSTEMTNVSFINNVLTDMYANLITKTGLAVLK